MRGLLIALEGLDRSGKTTQCQLIKEKVVDSVLFRFP